HEGARLRSRSLTFFSCTEFDPSYNFPNFALFTRQVSDKITSAFHLIPAPPKYQTVLKRQMRPQIGFQASPCLRRTLIDFTVQWIGGQGCGDCAQLHQCIVEPSMLECKTVNDRIDHSGFEVRFLAKDAIAR